MIALRATRQAVTIASQIRNPHIELPLAAAPVEADTGAEEIDHLPADAVALSCIRCRTLQWYNESVEAEGVDCAACDAEIVPPAPWFRHRRNAAVRRSKRRAILCVAVLLLAILGAVAPLLALALYEMWKQ